MTAGDATRVVVTGRGVMSGLGEDVATFWSGLAAGRSCIGRLDSDARIAAKICGRMIDFSLEKYLERNPGLPSRRTATLSKLLRATPFGPNLTACAALQAFVDAKAEGQLDPDRFAHVCAGQNLSLAYYAENLKSFAEHPDDIEPLLCMLALDTDTLGLVCELLGLKGPSAMVGGACASGNLAVISALDLIRNGRADAVMVTGAPASFHPMILHAWTMIEAITFQSFNDDPTRASRPFDKRREGFVPSEGSAAVVLESLESAQRRGATIYAELLGGASTCDACRLPKPHVEGQVRAMTLALEDAGVGVERVNYVNAHATSTPMGDAIEVEAISTLLGKRAAEVPINATKSMIGHGLTSAGVLELVATVLQLEHGLLHPTINQEEPDPALALDFVPNVARPHRIEVALSNSFGFGGINSCIVVGRPP